MRLRIKLRGCIFERQMHIVGIASNSLRVTPSLVVHRRECPQDNQALTLSCIIRRQNFVTRSVLCELFVHDSTGPSPRSPPWMSLDRAMLCKARELAEHLHPWEAIGLESHLFHQGRIGEQAKVPVLVSILPFHLVSSPILVLVMVAWT